MDADSIDSLVENPKIREGFNEWKNPQSSGQNDYLDAWPANETPIYKVEAGDMPQAAESMESIVMKGSPYRSSKSYSLRSIDNKNLKVPMLMLTDGSYNYAVIFADSGIAADDAENIKKYMTEVEKQFAGVAVLYEQPKSSKAEPVHSVLHSDKRMMGQDPVPMIQAYSKDGRISNYLVKEGKGRTYLQKDKAQFDMHIYDSDIFITSASMDSLGKIEPDVSERISAPYKD